MDISSCAEFVKYLEDTDDGAVTVMKLGENFGCRCCFALYLNSCVTATLIKVVFFILPAQEKVEMDVESYLRRRYESQIANIEIVEKEDLDLVSHLFFLFASPATVNCTLHGLKFLSTFISLFCV